MRTMQDRQKDQGEELTAVNLAEEGNSAHTVFIISNLSLEHKTALLELLREYKYVFFFAYTCSDISGLDPHLVMHQPNIKRNRANQVSHEEFLASASRVDQPRFRNC